MEQLREYTKQVQERLVDLYTNNRMKAHIALMVLASIILFIYLEYYYLDRKERKIINSLHPKLRGKAKRFLNSLRRAGIEYDVLSGLRSFQKQAELYEKRSTDPDKAVAPPGLSYHNYGLALDILPKNWGDMQSLANIGKSFGFEWGGDWQSVKDYPHFQMDYGYSSTQELLNKYKNGQTRIDGYVKL